MKKNNYFRYSKWMLYCVWWNGDSSLTRQDTSQTMFWKTVHRQNWRQFTDTFEDSSPTKFYIAFIFVKLKECPYFDHKILSHLSPLTLKVVGGTTDDFTTIPFHPSLSSAALRVSPNPIPIHSLMLSSHLFFCLPLLLAPFTVPCRIVFTMPEDLEIKILYHIINFYSHSCIFLDSNWLKVSHIHIKQN